MYLRDENGNIINAECSIDVINGADCIVVESSGGASPSRRVSRRNPQYNQLVHTILARLRDASVGVMNIILDSGRVAWLPEQARSVALSKPYPINLTPVDLKLLRKEIGRKVAAMHRAAGASTSGNQQKRIRICVNSRIDLARLIFGKSRPVSDPPEADHPPDMGATEKQ